MKLHQPCSPSSFHLTSLISNRLHHASSKVLHRRVSSPPSLFLFPPLLPNLTSPCPHSVNRFLDKTALSFSGAACIAAWHFFKTRAILGQSHTFIDHLRSNRWLSILVAFVALKTLHRTLNRLTRNHGWKADPPSWSMQKGRGDIVLITGGSTGIGKEIVERLAKKTPNIAVLDMAPPTYNASE